MRRLLAVFLLLSGAGTVQAEQNLLFIMDGSGSMWGRVDDTPKIAIARQVMADLAADLPADANVGLMAYGHRRKGDCSDIEGLVDLGPLDREVLAGKVRGINPRGKTPITAAVERAVERLRAIESRASVVLVSDGLESCGGDPCAAVRKAVESGVDLRLHVVGFGLGETDVSQLQCMAEAGGGRYFTAGSADELGAALQEAVAVSPVLRLAVTRNGEPARARVFVHPAGRDEELQRTSVGQAADSNPGRIELPAGRYDVVVRPRGVGGDPEKVLRGVIVPAQGEVARSVDFSDGSLRIRVTANGEPLQARTYAFPAEGGQEVDRDRTDGDGLAEYALPVGRYRVQVRPDGVAAPDRWVEDIAIAAGETVERDVDFSSGELAIRITTNGEPLEARTYAYPSEGDQEVDRDRTDKGGVARYALPVGRYRVRIRPDGIAAPDRWLEGIEIGAGATTERTVDLASGKLELRVTTNGEPLEARTYAFPADGEREADRDSTDRDGVARYALPVGRYRVKLRPEGVAAPTRWVEGLAVRAGQTTVHALDIPSGRLRVLARVAGKPVDVRTYVSHAGDGKEADRGSTGSDGAVDYRLPVGRYDIRLRSPDRDRFDEIRLEGVAVEAGATREVTAEFTASAAGG